jgi:hypothetical protein
VFVSFPYLVDKGEVDTLYPYKLPPMHALVNMPPKKFQLPIIIISIIKKPTHAKSTSIILPFFKVAKQKIQYPNPQIPQVREKKEDLSLLGGFHSGKLSALLLHFLD